MKVVWHCTFHSLVGLGAASCMAYTYCASSSASWSSSIFTLSIRIFLMNQWITEIPVTTSPLLAADIGLSLFTFHFLSTRCNFASTSEHRSAAESRVAIRSSILFFLGLCFFAKKNIINLRKHVIIIYITLINIFI